MPESPSLRKTAQLDGSVHSAQSSDFWNLVGYGDWGQVTII
jgi:hypothetical protein